MGFEPTVYHYDVSDFKSDEFQPISPHSHEFLPLVPNSMALPLSDHEARLLRTTYPKVGGDDRNRTCKPFGICF